MSVIRFSNVSKAYRMERRRGFLMTSALRRLIGRGRPIEFSWALRDVSFEIARGETLGVIGTNGSGKSTLLALAAGTSYPTEGEVQVEGRIGPLLELGAGFHPELTGGENVVLNASLLGMSREEIDACYDDVVAFSELGPYISSSISTYSTGMVARLGFAVLAHMRPDVLLIDEALSVGDASFRTKCETAMQGLLDAGTTAMFVSHDLAAVRRLCQRVAWLERGELRAIGPTEEVLNEYWKFIQAQQTGTPPTAS